MGVEKANLREGFEVGLFGDDEACIRLEVRVWDVSSWVKNGLERDQLGKMKGIISIRT